VICWGVPQWIGNRRFAGTALATSSAIVLVTLLLVSRQQVNYWKDSISLFEREVQVSRSSFLAHFHLAKALEEAGNLEKAWKQYSEALRIRPGFQLGHYHLANLFMKMGKTPEALNHFSISLALKPEDFRSHNNMGFLLFAEGKFAEAVHHFMETLRIHPEDRMARHNLDLALRKLRESGNP